MGEPRQLPPGGEFVNGRLVVTRLSCRDIFAAASTDRHCVWLQDANRGEQIQNGVQYWRVLSMLDRHPERRAPDITLALLSVAAALADSDPSQRPPERTNDHVA